MSEDTPEQPNLIPTTDENQILKSATAHPPRKSVKKKPTKKNTQNVGKVWTFPKNTLEDALRISRAIDEQNAGNPMKADILVKAVGFNKPTDWRFTDLLRSSEQYGLTNGTGSTATVSIEKIGRDIVTPSSPHERQEALVKAFRKVDDFKKVQDFYKDKKLPENEFFENTLIREFNIPRDRVQNFINCFTSNLKFIKAFKSEKPEELSDSDSTENLGDISQRFVTIEPNRTREYLDTCFVMMPFGKWFDQYYRDIYIPAIKEAGLEPIRSDELFSTGTVIEQIWEEISKAKVLLADLTGKNANVFYELGLAHAALKPVVFTSSSIDDVPFDLRHLRVVVYDINNPFWGEILRKNITSYLKNAKNDPSKSIPQPFRNEVKTVSGDRK